ncbi:MAG: thiamine phosphate synthase [Arcicella sp.]|nr:thiamine phosphate synthase [Arcicella sp.]
MKISTLHYITQDLTHVSHWEQARLACEGGADWVQLRVKNRAYSDWKETALRTQEVCKKFGATFIINDNAQIALEIEADGVHLGKTDFSPIEAREMLGGKFIIGGTSNTFEDVLFLHEAKVNYIGLGPFRFTKTKKNLSPILGLEGYQSILQQYKMANLSLPIIAIGGITLDDVAILKANNLHGIAISSLINLAENPVAVTKVLRKLLS